MNTRPFILITAPSSRETQCKVKQWHQYQKRESGLDGRDKGDEEANAAVTRSRTYSMYSGVEDRKATVFTEPPIHTTRLAGILIVFDYAARDTIPLIYL